MKFILFTIFCAIGFTASAQFWHRKTKPQVEEQERLPLLTEAIAHSNIVFTNTLNIRVQDIRDVQLPCSKEALELSEDIILSQAKYNMHFRIFDQASNNFSDLAALYVLQNRFSEAKWYLLQSNDISRRLNDTKHTLSNLLALADVKVQIGETALAKVDLQEARDIATAKGLQTDLAEINKRIQYLQSNKIASAKTIRYDEAVEIANSKAE